MKRVISQLLLFVVALSAVLAASAAQAADTKVIVDGLGREVEIPWPVTRAVVASRYNNEMIRACGAIDRVVAVDLNTAQDRVYWSGFDPGDVIGRGQTELNYEKIVDLKAQVLVTPSNGTYEQDEAKLAPFGVKVVVVTGWDNADMENQIAVVGRLFGVEDNAAKLWKFYEGHAQKLTERLGGLKERKKVYWEYGDPFTTCIPGTSNDGWHSMILLAGGENIFGDSKWAGRDIDPEKILLDDPDLIIKTSSGPALKNTGVYTPPTREMYDEITAEMTGRDGWSGLKAVKNKNLYCTTGFCAGGLGKLIGAVYTAKWLYPELTADIDPDAVFAEWMSLQGIAPIDGHWFRIP
jgi:iron complex transport system substrate-binding protein